MRHAETVTFGGSALDRAHELRGDDAALGAAIAAGQADTLVLWRGKPLVQGDALDRLMRLPMDHPVLAQSDLPPILLGREDGRLIFVHDISGWRPEGLDEDELGRFLDLSEQRHPELPGEAAFVELRRIMTRLAPRDAELAATARAMAGWHVSHR